MAKDVGYAINEARSLGLELTSAESASILLKRAMDAGQSEKDMSAVVEPLRTTKGK